MKHEDKIVQHIIANKGTMQHFVVAICGAADIGKSFISKNVTEILNKHSVGASRLTLDSFLMDRKERLKKGISGYDIESYDLKAIQKLLSLFYEGNNITFFPYNHGTGKKAKISKSLVGSEVLIIDGLLSMHEKLRPYTNFSIFVYTGDEQLRRIRCEADIVKRKQTIKLSQKLEPVEYQKYKRLVEPYKSEADLHVFLEKKWQYTVEINNNIV